MPVKLLATGGSRKAEKPVDHPVLYHFVGSFNSGKATFAAQLSSRSDFELRYTLHMRDNYTLDYARLNPDTMAVPTMEIDDRVCTDSYDMVMYLLEHYPGPGDAEVVRSGRKAEMLEFVDLARQWDEYMFTYGHMGEANSDLANGIRLAVLRQSLHTVLTERPADAAFLTEAYVQKIAGVECMRRAQQEGSRKEQDLAANIAQLHAILAKADALVAQRPHGFLFGPELTTADVFLLPIFRIFHVAVPQFFDEVWRKHPHLEAYWRRAVQHPDVENGLMWYVRKRAMAWAMLSRGAPLLLLKWKLGLLVAPGLPQEVEAQIAQATERQWEKVRGAGAAPDQQGD